MKKYNVSGMSCAACSARVEKAVTSVAGVTSCSVNLLTNSMLVAGDAKESDIIEAVQRAGYDASAAQTTVTKENKAQNKDTSAKKSVNILRNRLVASIAFLILLMYISMGHVMWGWPLPAYIAQNPLAIGLLQLLLATAIMVINQQFFVSGVRGLLHRAPNMDTLVSLGSGASFIYSTYVLFAMSDAVLLGDALSAHHGLHSLYFESAAMILALITLGKMLEAHSKGKTTDALRSLIDLAPKTAIVVKNNEETEIPIERLRVGDVFVVRPGASVPADGVVLSGHSAINESALTGESIPVDKAEGDFVSAATINSSGVLKCEATRVGEDTSLAKIIKLVSDASGSKAPIAKVADKVSGVFVPIVMGIAVLTVCVWLLLGQEVGQALSYGISVLVISCPCALGLATPVAIMVGSGVGAKCGILFKTAEALEQTGKVRVVALDKTGTITKGVPKVTDILPAEGITEQVLLRLAAALEKNSEHPLALAVMEKAKEKQIEPEEVKEFHALPGNGLKAKLEESTLLGGNLTFISQQVALSTEVLSQYDALATPGKTPLLFAKNNVFYGIIAVADAIKEDSYEAIEELKSMGLHVVMLTGDNERTAKAIATQAGVDEVIADVLPDGKEQVIIDLQKRGRTAMVGDGINDAPALVRADVGIAIGSGTDVAIDSADVVLVKNSLNGVSSAIQLSRKVLLNIHQNLFWAFFYNIIGIPLAVGVFKAALGWSLSPMFGAAAMSLSSFCVVSNALRLNLFKADKKTLDERKFNMKKTMIIEGMMCPHCEGRVKACLEGLQQVESAVVSHEKNEAQVTLLSEISDNELKEAVEAQGYKVLSVK